MMTKRTIAELHVEIEDLRLEQTRLVNISLLNAAYREHGLEVLAYEGPAHDGLDGRRYARAAVRRSGRPKERSV